MSLKSDANPAARIGADAGANAPKLASSGNGWSTALLGAAAGIALTLFALWPTVRGLAMTWSVSDSYRYGWLVVPTLVYLLGWHHRGLLLSLAPRPGFAGVQIGLLGALLWVVSELMNVDVGRQLALVLVLQGVAMAALGWRVYCRLFPLLALLFLMIPSGDILLAPLRQLTLESIVWVAGIAGMAPRVDGYVITIGQGAYIVIDECAGLTFVTLGLFLGYSLGLMLVPSFVKAAALALAGAALAVVSNMVRVNAIVLIDWLRGSQMDLTAHSWFQSLAMVLGIGLLFLLFYRVASGAQPVSAPEVVGDQAGRVWMLRRLAPACVGLLVVLIASGTARMLTLDPHSATCRAVPDFLPTDLRGWQAGAMPTDWTVDALDQLRSVRATYMLDGRAMQVVVVEAVSPTAKLPRVLSLAGEPGQWREKLAQTRELCSSDGCIRLRQTIWIGTDDSDQRHMVHAYQVGAFSTTSDLAMRAFHGWRRLSGHVDRPRLVGLMVDGATVLPDDTLERLFQTLQQALAAHPC